MGLSRHGPLARFAVAVLAILLLGARGSGIQRGLHTVGARAARRVWVWMKKFGWSGLSYLHLANLCQTILEDSGITGPNAVQVSKDILAHKVCCLNHFPFMKIYSCISRDNWHPFYGNVDILLIKMIRCQPWATRCAATNFSSTYLWHPISTASGALPTVGRRWSVREPTRSQCAKPFRVDCWSRSCRRWNPQKIAASRAFVFFCVWLNLLWRWG